MKILIEFETKEDIDPSDLLTEIMELMDANADLAEDQLVDKVIAAELK